MPNLRCILARLLLATSIAALATVLALADSPAPFRNSTNFHHTSWNSLGAVFDLKQSPEGFLWLTTSKGVFRFDGVRFQSIEEVTRGAVRDEDIDSVFMSSSGGLWLTTQGAGLLLWKDGSLTEFPDRRCTPIRKQGKLIEDLDGSLWVQATAGLFRLRGSACEQIGTEQGYPGGFPAGILLDTDGTLWVKTATGPLLYLPRGQAHFHVSKAGDGLSTGYAYLHESPEGGIWLSDNQGLRRVAGKLSLSSGLQSERAYRGTLQYGDFAFASDGTLWAITETGVQRLDDVERWPAPLATQTASRETFSLEQGLSSDAVWKVLIDREGVWVGTNSGLDCFRRAALATVRLPRAPEHEYAVAAGDNNSVWTGNSSMPLTELRADGKLTSFPSIHQTVTIRRDHSGTIWSAGDSQLWRSTGSTFERLRYPDESLDSVVFVATDRNDNAWITTTSGHTYLQSGAKWIDETQTLGKKPGVIGTMADDRAGNVWFAFSNKVVRWDGSNYERYSFPDGERGVSENTMSIQGDHVWLAGARGVELFTRGHFYIMSWKQPDLPGRISGIVETPAGDLWMNGFSGIAHVSASELKAWLKDPGSAVSGERLDELDGLPGLSGETFPEPSLVQSPDGRLWFATTKGIAWLDPEAFERNRNQVPPPVLVSAVIADGKTYADTMKARLPAQTQDLEIDYTAPSLAIPERVFFRYKLDGVDRDWQDVGARRAAYYTKLRPGHYTFHVVACNNNGVWNQTGATVGFSVAPAWFQTAWFGALSGTLVLFLAGAAYHLRMRQVAAKINARFNERLAERTRIAQELHDTLLQGFLSASMQVHVAADRLPANSTVKPILTRALEVMTQVIDEGRNALRGLRLSNSASLDLEQAFGAIRQEFENGIDQKSEVEFHIITEGQHRALHPLLRDEVYRIGREAVTNAFRHSRATRIDVELKYGVNQLRLLVYDDGCGIEPDILLKGKHGHWGLSGMRERAERIGAKLHVFSRASAGTEVELLVPGRVAFQDEPGGVVHWFREHGYINRSRMRTELHAAEQGGAATSDAGEVAAGERKSVR
jgi:signal transduction histidine kinase/ligand-binding sensor domain-containing protein